MPKMATSIGEVWLATQIPGIDLIGPKSKISKNKISKNLKSKCLCRKKSLQIKAGKKETAYHFQQVYFAHCEM